MNHNKQDNPRPILTFAFASWCVILAVLFLSAVGQTGCSTVAGMASGAVHGLADDMDSLTDKLAKDKQDRQRLQYDRYE